MFEINSCNSSNNNYNSNSESEKSVSIEVPSVSGIMSTVSQMISSCQFMIKLVDLKEVSQCLPHFQNILSEMNEMVAFTHQQQQENPEEWKELMLSQEDSSMLSPELSSSSSITSSLDSSESMAVGDLFINKLSATINKFAPDSIFNKKKAKKLRKKKLLMKVPRVLRAIWQNCDTIFCQASGPGPQQFNHQPEISVDWSKVNIRALSNLPKPQDIPLYGCSLNPNQYNHWHEQRCPFGSIPGYSTSLGVISLDSIKQPIHGFIYNKEMGGWVIHASREKDVNFNNRKQGKRKLLEKKTGSTPIRRSPD